MIFSSKNEWGTPAWKQVISGTKTATRRLKPATVGSYRAVQPKRTAKGRGFVHIQGCEKHTDWMRYMRTCFGGKVLQKKLEEEAHREGFDTWSGLLNWFTTHKIDINDTYVLSIFYVKKKTLQ